MRRKGEFTEKRERAVARQRFFDAVRASSDALARGEQRLLTIGGQTVKPMFDRLLSIPMHADWIPSTHAVVRRPGLGYSLAEMSAQRGLLASTDKCSFSVRLEDIVFWCEVVA